MQLSRTLFNFFSTSGPEASGVAEARLNLLTTAVLHTGPRSVHRQEVAINACFFF